MFLKCELIKIPQFSGNKGSVYTIRIDENENTAFKDFVEENQTSFKGEIKEIVGRLRTMGFLTGMRRDYFKTHEGIPGDGVCALV